MSFPHPSLHPLFGVSGMHRYLVPWSSSLRFLQLTIFILLFLLIMPLLSGHPFIIICFHLLLLNALLVSLSASERLPRLRLVLVMFWLFGLVLYFKATLFPEWGPFGLAMFLGAAFYLLFLLGCTAAILIYVFQKPPDHPGHHLRGSGGLLLPQHHLCHPLHHVICL